MKKFEEGITLIEIVVMIFIIVLFTLVLVVGFPKIQRQYALSRATYKLAQDLRKTEDLALSGVKIKDEDGKQVAAKGYGVYVSPPGSSPKPGKQTQYLIYADLNDNRIYDGNFSTRLCSEQSNIKKDCPIEVIDISNENINLEINSIQTDKGIAGGGWGSNSMPISINFTPPNPTIKISDSKTDTDYYGAKIILKIDIDGTYRTVLTNISGLISVQ